MAGSITSFTHEALEILFYLCVQTHQTSVVKGVEKSKPVGELARPETGPHLPFLDIIILHFHCIQ